MPLYPTLEDLLVDQYQTSYGSLASPDAQPFRSRVQPSAPVYEPTGSIPKSTSQSRIYEAIDENILPAAPPEMLGYPTLPSYYESIAQRQSTSLPFQNSSFRPPEIAVNHHPAPPPPTPTAAVVQQYPVNGVTLLGNDWVIAPITSQCSGLAKANLTHGVRKVILQRTKAKKYGLRMRAVNKGVFVQLVTEGSPAAAAGIRFSDQVLSINDIEVLGMSGQKVMDMIKKSKHELTLILRDRPLARTITLHKDAAGVLGFSHKDNLITAVMKESSASRNGLLINQRIVEIDGRNVMAFKNKEIKACLEDAPMTVTLTLMPAEFYDEITKKLDWSLMKKQDHSVPQV